MNQELLQFLIDKKDLNIETAEKIINLFDQYYSVYYIFRYRKDIIRDMNLHLLKNLHNRYSHYMNLKKIKETFLEEIKGSVNLVPRRALKLLEITKDEIILNDICDVIKNIIETKTKKNNFDQAAEQLIQEYKLPLTRIEFIKDIISRNPEFKNEKEVISELVNKISEKISINLDLRFNLRERILQVADYICTLNKNHHRRNVKYENFYNYSGKIKDITAEEFFAIEKGASEGLLLARISLFEEPTIKFIESIIIKNFKSPFVKEIKDAILTAYRRKFSSEIKTLALKIIRRKFENQIINDICHKFNIFLQSFSIGASYVVGIIPSLKEGYKAAVINPSGDLLDYFTIHPFFSRNLADEAKSRLLEIIQKYEIKFIAVAGEAGSIEIKDFIDKLAKEEKISDLLTIISDKTLSSAYSESAAAKEEMPHLDSFFRYAVSIARKLQNPYRECSKFSLSAIKFHPFQDLINLEKLDKEMGIVMSDYINYNGININTSSYNELLFVPGINSEVAQNIVKHRSVFGPFKSRDDLKNVPKMSEKIFTDSSGFIFINESENQLDKMFIHKNDYKTVKKISEALMISVPDLIENKNLQKLDPRTFSDGNNDKANVECIINELLSPSNKYNKKTPPLEFNFSVSGFDELKENSIINGIISNFSPFGIFVDIGIEQKGLIHVSEIPINNYFENPGEFYFTGQNIKTKIIQIDKEKKRINLSLKL